GLAQKFVQSATSGPFLLEVATFAPHAPYTPAPRYVGTLNEKVPRIPSFATPNVNPPKWLSQHGQLDAMEIKQPDRDYNLRAEAVKGVDDLIAALQAELVTRGIDQETYFIFSSDNGYHMGEHNLYEGKQTAFDHDINVPLIVVGPGVRAGATVDAIVENI